VNNASRTNNAGVKSSGGTSDVMQQFFNDVEVVKGNIVAIKEATTKIGEININVLQATTTDKEHEFSNELEPLIKTTNKKAQIAKQLLQRLREDTDKLKGEKKPTPEVRIRENLTNTLTRKFVDVMKEYQNSQTKYKTDIKKKVKRQVQIVKPDATSEEIDAVFKSGGGSGEVFKNAILTVSFSFVLLSSSLVVFSVLMISCVCQGEAADSIRNAYMNVADKYHDVLTLEASVAELHQMFLDFALLTDKQGELLDQIEHQVKEASDYIDQGNQEMVEAIEIQKSIRKKQCCLLLIALIIIGIIVGIVVAKVQGAF
jgi:t-SNARE complex subunit (syntaxin)